SGSLRRCSQSLTVPIGIWNAAAKSSCESLSARRMMLTCGIRGAALHSASVIGLLSGSAEAAARRCFAVIASARLQSILLPGLAFFFMVASLLSWLGKTRRDDAYPLAAQGVGDGKQTVFDHPKHDEAVFSVVLPPI